MLTEQEACQLLDLMDKVIHPEDGNEKAAMDFLTSIACNLDSTETLTEFAALISTAGF